MTEEEYGIVGQLREMKKGWSVGEGHVRAENMKTQCGGGRERERERGEGEGVRHKERDQE